MGARTLLAVVLGACHLLALAVPAMAVQAERAAFGPGSLHGVWQIAPQRGEVPDPRLRIPARAAPPLKPGAAPAYEARRRALREAEEKGAPLAVERVDCVPDGFPRMLGTTLPIEIIESPGKLTMIVEFNTQVRHIYLGAKHPPTDELEFNFFGNSIGRWEGDTLVVETIGIQPSTLLFDDAPHGERLRVTERYRLLTPDILELELTMTDPDTLAAPWTVKRVFARQPGMRLREFVCQQNNRNYRGADGTIATDIKD